MTRSLRPHLRAAMPATLTLAAVLGLAAACNNPSYRPKLTESAPQAGLTSGKQALGAVALSVSVPVPSGGAANRCSDTISQVFVYFQPYNRATGKTIRTFRPYVYQRDHVLTIESGRGIGTSKAFAQPLHRVFVLEPGDYVIKQVDMRRDRYLRQFAMVRTADNRQQGGDISPVDYANEAPIGNAPRFTVRAGEVVNLGNWTLCAPDMPDRSALKISEAAGSAQTALARYPKLKGTPVYRPLARQ